MEPREGLTSGKPVTDEERAQALALSCFLAEHGWPLRVPTGNMTPVELWRLGEQELAALLGLPSKAIPRLAAFRASFDAAAKFAQLERQGITLVTLGENCYPEFLARIHDPPPALFMKGKENRLADFVRQPRVAIVGARKASTYGMDAAFTIASGLASAGVCVISGMAIGIDAAAHRGALSQNGSSLAVLGCGPDIIYPAVNRKLYSTLIGRGLIVSEYPPGARAMPWRFPARNRIMAGLSQAVIVVEARGKSGALITADFCLEEGRDVFAVPGSIFSDLSAGPHRLIQWGAGIAASAEDVLESLGLEQQRQLLLELHQAPEATDLTEDERSLLEALGSQPMHQDVLAARAGLDGSRAAAALISLELQGLACLDPARGYRRGR
ncbi:MAG: DNA-processing protein DprA [Actinobacteria bacterium]|nr:DNA-processing protein DprA [Actinomycetota bacterium]